MTLNAQVKSKIANLAIGSHWEQSRVLVFI